MELTSDDESQRHDVFSCFRLPVVNDDGTNERDASWRDRREIIVMRERIVNNTMKLAN